MGSAVVSVTVPLFSPSCMLSSVASLVSGAQDAVTEAATSGSGEDQCAP